MTVRSLVHPEYEPIIFPASSSRIIDACFAHPESDQIAVLSEDQSISIWEVSEKLKPKKLHVSSKVENGQLKHIKWNPYNNDEIFCFSQKQVFILRINSSIFELLLPLTEPEIIEDIFFIFKVQECKHL